MPPAWWSTSATTSRRRPWPATASSEIPVSDYSAVDRLYRMAFANADEAAAAKAKLAHDPSVESVDFDALASIPPGEEVPALAPAGESLEAQCGIAAAPPTSSRTTPASSYQWHFKQIGMPTAWKRGNGNGAVVAVIDTGVSKVADLADTKFVPGYNFVDNTADAADDHGHGTHVAGTIAQSTNNKLGVAGIAYGASHHAAQGPVGARLGLGGRHRPGHPLGRRPRRQRHQHEPRRSDRRSGRWGAP